MGWWLDEENIAQISLNLLDHEITPMHVAYEEAVKDAKVHKVIHSNNYVIFYFRGTKEIIDSFHTLCNV